MVVSSPPSSVRSLRANRVRSLPLYVRIRLAKTRTTSDPAAGIQATQTAYPVKSLRTNTNPRKYEQSPDRPRIIFSRSHLLLDHFGPRLRRLGPLARTPKALLRLTPPILLHPSPSEEPFEPRLRALRSTFLSDRRIRFSSQSPFQRFAAIFELFNSPREIVWGTRW